MKKFITAVVVVAAMTTPVAFAQNEHFGHRHHNMAKFAEKLGLTDAQKQQVKDIRQADRQANKALFEQFRAKKQELRTLRQNNDPNAESVKAELKSLHQQLHAAQKATREKIYNTVLTPEQRAQIDTWRAKRQ
ncbi:MAG TPA: Spy/CpxP family protein refolding chaperone, partial [Thermoanaerobaculia bacterium]|nr:Spy/CpxP family protein refolding chaperone [Thermoanaerobaculia bacterium]